jgi:hypothetical protein
LDKNSFESKGKNFDVYYWKYHTHPEGFMRRTFKKIDCPIYYKTSRFFDIE